MATLRASGSSNTSPRWGRTGEPGSAFSGLGRGRGRGRGSAGGSRGGRGRAREARDGLSEVDVSSTKPDNSQSTTSPTKSSISSSLSTPTLGKPNLPPSFSLKPKSAPRRGSRAISVTTAPQINESVVTASVSTPPSAKVSYKRRRSHVGKPAFHVPSKANVPTSTGSLLCSNKFHESHTETLKDIPPHLYGKFDVRNDIDALVERVRAVAMDKRPSTPRSHIDWAVDDDDTLPDLDDWGVTTSTLTTQLEGISPIIVDGLRSLPEFAANSTVPSPLKQVEAVTVQPIMDAQSSLVNGMTPGTTILPNPRSTREEDIESKFSSESMAICDPRTVVPLKPNSPQPKASLSFYPSLPNIPLSVDSVVQLTSKLRPPPMRFVPHPTSPITPMMDLSGMLERSPAANSKQIDAQEAVEVAFETTDHKAATWTSEPRLKDPDHLIVVEPITESVILNVSPNRGPSYTQIAQEPSPPSGLSGLRASMHAPKGIVNSISTPADISTQTDSRTHDPIHTHMRAHTVGQSPLPTIHGQGDYISRVTRSGYTTPKGKFQGTSHVRTRSTPPGGANHYRSPHTSRPVITGDAISRLARTIEKTHYDPSPPISDS